MRKAAPIGLALLACLPFSCGRNREGRLVVLQHTIRITNPGGEIVPSLLYRVWRVGVHGRVVPFPHDFPDSYVDSVQGSTAPSLSPDGRWVAYGNQSTDDYDIHLLNARTLRQHEITHWGKPGTINSVSVDVLIAGWSPDSQKVLLNVTRGEDISEEGEITIPKAPYGFHEYEVASRKDVPVRLPGGFAFVAWVPGGRFIGVMSGGLPSDDKLVMLRSGKAGQTEITAINTSPYQARASRDRKWLVGLHSGNGRMPGNGTAQIVKVNMATLTATPLVTLSSWSGNERPALSPDDKHVAYKREKREHETYYTPRESLFVDDRSIYSCSGTIDFEWVDDRMIALACQDEVLVLDMRNGRTLGKQKLAPSQARH